MKRTKGLIIVLSLLILGGCYDKTELEQQAFVIAVGIDKAEDDGQYQISFQVAQGQLRGGQAEGELQKNITIQANDIIAAKSTANTLIAREINLDQTKVLIVSEELARSGELLNVLQATTRAAAFRRGVQLIITRENASEFLANNDPPLEVKPHKYYQLMMQQSSSTGLIPDADIHRFFQITEGDADLFLGIYATATRLQDKPALEDEFYAGQVPQKGEQDTQFIGSAVFKEGVMIDTLTGEETRLSMILDNTQHIEDILINFPDPKSEVHRISARLIKERTTNISIKMKEDEPAQIDVVVPFHLELLAVPSLIEYGTNQENLKMLERAVEEKFNQEAGKLIKKSQDVYGSEPFYWSLYVRRYFRTIQEYEQADWNNRIYPNANIDVKFDMEAIRFGKLIQNTDMREVRD
ncbi:Ger(x)C family spore germination protein [Alkalihalophilus pseudofirmus]|uniref:Ger(x)C family spore germination protein n=1 Tax=Alkalihalophilus pseudofirmus TaxID=79885 RepID=UPI00259AEDAA|nr:Ger(x)C family spore germination protein [Alkalihalophilus pseudofirmus]WEG17866.1 Ger(x)C family spore germination protein [Alkalihalophilus pseudofirmus]